MHDFFAIFIVRLETEHTFWAFLQKGCNTLRITAGLRTGLRFTLASNIQFVTRAYSLGVTTRCVLCLQHALQRRVSQIPSLFIVTNMQLVHCSVIPPINYVY